MMNDGRASTKALRILAAWLAQAAALFAAWELLVWKTTWEEVTLGLGACAVAATASTLTLLSGAAKVKGWGAGWLQAWRLFGYAFSGTYEIFGVLARHLFTATKADSLFLTVPFEPCGDDAQPSTQRALAIAYTTVTPNFIVVGVDRRRRHLLYHQIRRSPVLELTRRLGARP